MALPRIAAETMMAKAKIIAVKCFFMVCIGFGRIWFGDFYKFRNKSLGSISIQDEF
jgi:hypothetical protein